MAAQRNVPRSKRGIVLLLVISLLALFVLIGVTYALVAARYLDAAKTQTLQQQTGDLPEKEIDIVLAQILYDTLHTTSLQGHGLLTDMYGPDLVLGTVSGTPSFADSNQVLVLQINPSGSASSIPDYYNGRVLTFTTGQLQGKSVRILQYSPGGTPTIAVIPASANFPSGILPSANDNFVINGLPFNGAGFGYDTATGSQNLEISGYAGQFYALLPHFAGYGSPSAVYTASAGGPDESYDAADYQNMFLSMVPPRRATNNMALLPSYHRPELVNYWQHNLPTDLQPGPLDPTNPTHRDFLRKIIFRPMPWDHPNFTGSNSAFVGSANALANAANPQGIWDIDNDGDGIRDTIWIDAGLPLITTPDGKRVKRLFGILIKDLDGRINLNVHGNREQITSANNRSATPISSPIAWAAGTDPSTPTPVTLPRGLGYGPAEIDFLNVFGGYPGGATAFNYFLVGNGTFPGRYGPDGVPGNSTGAADEPLSAMRTLGMPANHTTAWSVYASPPDVWGRGAMGLDYYGMPVWGNLGVSETIDDPYEIQFDPTRALGDRPFTPYELERLLRYHDADQANSPSRILTFAGGQLSSETAGVPGQGQVWREVLTTMGYHVPVAPAPLARELRTDGMGGQLLGPGKTLLDLYVNKGVNPANTTDWRAIVPFEVRHGELFNINRPLGDGQNQAPSSNYPPSNPGTYAATINTVVDDPSESDPMVTETLPGGWNMEKLNDDQSGAEPPQIFARHLYCLMLAVMNPNWQVPFDVDGNGTQDVSDTRRFIAQWAINVVDFRDPDSIMTRFEYDLNPFDGWNPSAVVWGCERPELLISETLAFHDRRTEDLDSEKAEPGGGQGTKTDDTNNKDADYDQRLMPRGAAYIELYNPWVDLYGGTYDHKPLELYSQWNSGVNLQAYSGDSPVWRMLVVKGNTHSAISNSNSNPDLPQPGNIPGNDVERSVYFVDPTALDGRGGAGLSHGVPFFCNVNVAPLLPGRYAVVGSSGWTDDNTTTPTVYIGRDDQNGGGIDDNFDRSKTRRIILSPNTNPNSGGQVEIRDNLMAGSDDVGSLSIQPPIAVPISQPRSFSITEPTSGYDASSQAGPPVFDITQAAGEGANTPPADIPLDDPSQRPGWDFLNHDGTRGNVRTILLQRLANPLIPWDPQANPYITVDCSSVDVTSYNGAVNDAADPKNDPKNAINFSTFQRGGSDTTIAPWDGSNGPDQYRKLWPIFQPRNGNATAASPTDGAGPNQMEYKLLHTLGYLNSNYGPFINSGSYKGAPNFSGGMGSMTFPWLAFRNRPFTSPTELMEVPTTNQYDLVNLFAIRSTTTPTEYAVANVRAPYGTRLNFFFHGNSNASNVTSNPDQTDPQFFRLLEYVGVPTPYVHADMYFNPSHFRTAAAAFGDPATTYRPPFHRISRFRDPGRININTIFDSSVLEALFTNSPNMNRAAFANDLLLSRQGYTGGGVLQMDNNHPSLFSQPFRAADASDLAPNVANLPQLPVHGGLLRGTQPNPTPNPGQPLFAFNAPALVGPGNLEFQDSDRNPYFRYQNFQKLGNLLTTRSNCFAVWITVGYFEAEVAGVTAGTPDGYALGQEIGFDTGEVTRHRAFFIIDRSVPVGFIPGQKLNAMDCVLLRRFIE